MIKNGRLRRFIPIAVLSRVERGPARAAETAFKNGPPRSAAPAAGTQAGHGADDLGWG